MVEVDLSTENQGLGSSGVRLQVALIFASVLFEGIHSWLNSNISLLFGPAET